MGGEGAEVGERGVMDCAVSTGLYLVMYLLQRKKGRPRTLGSH